MFSYINNIVKEGRLNMRKKERQQKGKSILKVLPIVCVVILVVVLVVVLKNVMADKKINFWSVTSEMVEADHTQYNYTLTIDTSDKTSDSSSSSNTMSKEDVENIEAEGDTEEDATKSASGTGVSVESDIEYNINNSHFSNVWSDASGVEDYTDTNVKCTLEISGYSEGDNFKTTLKLGCNDDTSKDLFDIIFVDGTYYIGVGNFKDGLKNSGVGSLVKLGNDLPDGVRYLTISEKDFVVLTGLNEKSGKGYLRTRDGAIEMLQRSIDAFLGKIETYTDKKDLKKQKQDDSVTCGFTCADSGVIFGALKNYLAYNTDNYKTQINDMVKDKYISEDDKTIALSEVDNLSKFSSKYLEVINAMSNEEIKASGIKVNAQITRDGKKTYKPNYRLEFNRMNKHYTVGFSGECNIGAGGDKIVAPEETSIDITKYDNGGEGWKNYFIRFMNYFNVIGVDLETGSTRTVGEISSEMLDSLCRIINKTHEAEEGWQQVSRGTLSDYIASHKEDDEVIKSFLDTFDKYTAEQENAEVTKKETKEETKSEKE